MTPNDFGRAVEGPIMNMPIMAQIDESIFWLRNVLPLHFDLRIYMTQELINYICQSITVNFRDQMMTIFGVPISRTDGEGLRWWVGVPGFVIPQEVTEDDTTDSL